DEANLDRIIARRENDGYRRGRRHGFPYTAASYEHDGDLTANQIRRQRGQSIILALGPTKFDRNVLALDVAGLGEAVAKRGNVGRPRSRPLTREKPDYPYLGCLRTRN